jgi:hypothetical protein
LCSVKINLGLETLGDFGKVLGPKYLFVDSSVTGFAITKDGVVDRATSVLDCCPVSVLPGTWSSGKLRQPP